MDKTCYIFGAGEYGAASIAPHSLDKKYIIAADGGYSYLKAANILPDLAVGDFDSLQYIPKDIPVIQHPVMKDDTDMMLAVKEGFKRGFDNFIIFGGLGGRLDHTLANLQLLKFISKNNGSGFLIGENTVVTLLNSGSLIFPREYSGIISVFCLDSTANGVSISGLKYCIENTVLSNDMPLGVSNEFIGKQAKIDVLEGNLLAIWEGNICRDLPIYRKCEAKNKTITL